MKILDVGLTGGIACGKSMAAGMFKAYGAYVIDADKVYHDLIRQGQPLYSKLVKEFGDDILADDGEVHRRKLARIVFNDDGKRECLNKLAHPAVVKEQERLKKEYKKQNKHLDQTVIITDAALMIEAGTYKRYDKLVVVTATAEVQLSRLMKRSGCSIEDARSRIASQLPVAEKAALADYVIENNGTVEELIRRVEEVYYHLTEDLARK